MWLWFLVLLTQDMSCAFVVPNSKTPQEVHEFYQSISVMLSKWAVLYPDPKTWELSIVATEDLKFGTSYMHILLSLAISSFQNFDWFPYVKDGGPEQILIARLIFERFVNQRGTFVTEFVHSLPTHYDSMLNWSAEEVQELHTHAQLPKDFRVNLLFDQGHSWFVRALMNVPQVKKYCPICLYPEVYQWAYFTVFDASVRQDLDSWKALNGYPVQKEDHNVVGLTLCPLMNLLKHVPAPFSSRTSGVRFIEITSGKSPGYEMKTDRDYKKGSALSWEFHPESNLELLFLHGVVVDKNHNDQFEISFLSPVHCLGANSSDSYCRLPINPIEHSDDFLNMLRQGVSGVNYTLPSARDGVEYYKRLGKDSVPENRTQFLEALCRYRLSIVEIRTQSSREWSLRTERRTLSTLEPGSNRQKLMFRFGISQKLLLLQHQKLAEKLLMKVLWTDLFSPCSDDPQPV